MLRPISTSELHRALNNVGQNNTAQNLVRSRQTLLGIGKGPAPNFGNFSAEL